MSWTLCTSGAAVLKAGTHANSISTSGSALAEWSTEAEGKIEADTGFSWVTNYSGLSTGIKGALSEVCSSLIAMKIIAYDVTGYLRREADTLMNFNDEIVTKGLATLKDKAVNTLKTP